MEQEHIAHLLPEYLDNLLESAQREKVEAHLKECESCTKEWTQMKTLFNAFDQDPVIRPSHTLRTNFLRQLEDEKQNAPKTIPLHATPRKIGKPWSGMVLKWAASIALLIGSYMLGKYQEEQKRTLEIAAIENESLHLKQMAMISLMENQSASKRIQGVHFIEEFKKPDEAVVNALAARMLHDGNTNVRLAAVEALSRFTTSENVKTLFITALETEKDPGIQITIIQLLVKIQEKKALKPMRQLLQQEDTQPFVKEHIESLLPTII